MPPLAGSSCDWGCVGLLDISFRLSGWERASIAIFSVEFNADALYLDKMSKNNPNHTGDLYSRAASIESLVRNIWNVGPEMGMNKLQLGRLRG